MEALSKSGKYVGKHGLAEFDLSSEGGVLVMRVGGLMTHSDSGVFRVMLEKAVRDTGPTPLIEEYVASTPRKQPSTRPARSQLDGSGRRRIST